MIDLRLPQSTIVGKSVPKNAFYKHLEVNSKIKQHFVDDVVCINWLYKLAPSTLNVADGMTVHEIVVFAAVLKNKDCPNDVFIFIDQNIPRHVIFILEYESQYKLLLNYKEWSDASKKVFKIVKTFTTEWLSLDQIKLSIGGLSMDALYESIAGQISGYGTSNSEDTKRIIELQTLIDKANREVEIMQRKVRNERQLSRQIELNSEARKLIKKIAEWQNELQTIKH